MKTILVTSKINPDLDGFACSYAYTRLLNQINKDVNIRYICGIYGNFQPEVEFMINYLSLSSFEHNPNQKFDNFIIVDASDIKGMPKCIRPLDILEVIDHREKDRARELFPQAKIELDLIGAAATLIFEKYNQYNAKLDCDSAILLYGAIHSNTLDLKVKITSDRDRVASNYLKTKFNILDTLIMKMFKYKTDKIFNNLEINIINDFKSRDLNLINIGIAQIEGVDILDLIEVNLSVIKKILFKIKNNNNLDYIFLTAVDIIKENNIFVTIDTKTEDILSRVMKINFKNGLGILNKMLLRKQIIPILLNKGL